MAQITHGRPPGAGGVDANHRRRFDPGNRRRFLFVAVALGLDRLVSGTPTDRVIAELELAVVAALADDRRSAWQ